MSTTGSSLIRVGFGVDREEPVVDIEVQIDEEPEADTEASSEEAKEAGVRVEDELWVVSASRKVDQ